MKALLDPFNFRGNDLPCVPDLIDVPSQKVCTLTRITATTGTAGFGYIVVNPVVGSSATNPTIYGRVSTSAFAGNSLATTLPTTGVIGFDDAGYPYPGSAGARNHRTVACAIRARYIGTELDRGGRILAVRSPSNDSMSLATADQVLSRTSTTTHQVSRNWTTVGWLPSLPSDTEYSESSLLDLWTMALVFESKAGNSFECEVVRYHEFLPGQVAGTVYPVTAVTQSHSDINAMSYIRDFVGGLAASDIGQGIFKKGLQHVTNLAASAMGLPMGQLAIEF